MHRRDIEDLPDADHELRMQRRDSEVLLDAHATSLPIELIASCFSHLDVRERVRAGAVCRAWLTASKSPPFSLRLDLDVIADDTPLEAVVSMEERFRRAYTPEARPRAPRALRWREAARVLSLGACAGLAELGLTVFCSYAEEEDLEPPPLLVSMRALLAACAPSLAHLDARFPAPDGQLPDSLPACCVLVAKAATAAALPRLRSISFVGPFGPVLHFSSQLLMHLPGSLEYVGANLGNPKQPRLVLPRLPSLRGVYSLRLLGGPFGSSSILEDAAALAAAGIACRRLEVIFKDAVYPRGSGVDARHPEAFAALAGLFRPLGVPPRDGPAALLLDRVLLPDPLPRDAFAGVQELEMRNCGVTASTLGWLLARAPTLETVQLDCELEGVAPADLFEAAGRLREGTRLLIGVRTAWPAGPAAVALEALASSAPTRLLHRLGVFLSDRAPGPDAPNHSEEVRAALGRLHAAQAAAGVRLDL
eukprot:tig00001374_g8510.t1